MSSMIKMNKAHDENISCCASGTVESPCQPSNGWFGAKTSLTAIFRVYLIVGLSSYAS